MAAATGLHLLQGLDLIDSPRTSALAGLDADGRLTRLDEARTDDEVAALVAADPEAQALAVDAPLHVPNATGRRPSEELLAWLDVAAFPVSAQRLDTVHGGARGVALAPRLARAGLALVEALPDQVLRQIAWEHDHPPGAPPLDLGEYRTAWIGVRAPVFRPKRTGRARPDGTIAAWRLLAEAVDLGGWAPDPAPPDDWAAIADAARVDAILCAYAALRAVRGEAVAVATAPGGWVVLPADANLAGRAMAAGKRLGVQACPAAATL